MTETEVSPVARRVAEPLVVFHHHAKACEIAFEDAGAYWRTAKKRRRVATLTNAYRAKLSDDLRSVRPAAGFAEQREGMWLHVSIEDLGCFGWQSIENIDPDWLEARPDVNPMPISSRQVQGTVSIERRYGGRAGILRSSYCHEACGRQRLPNP